MPGRYPIMSKLVFGAFQKPVMSLYPQSAISRRCNEPDPGHLRKHTIDFDINLF